MGIAPSEWEGLTLLERQEFIEEHERMEEEARDSG